MCKLKVLYLILAGVWTIRADYILRITNLEVPEGPLRHQDAPLNCKYEIGESDTLYDVKWYKDDDQFFRCLADGTVQEYSVAGLTMHHSGRSALGACPVTILRVNDQSSGLYKCEVSLDHPTYKSVIQTAVMRVIHYPKQNIYTTDINTAVETITHPSSMQYSPSTESGSSNCLIYSSVVSLVFINVLFIYLYL